MPEQDSPADPFFDEALQIDKFVEIVLEGFSYARIMEAMTDMIRGFAVKGFATHPVVDDAVYAKTKKRAQELGEFARSEAREGHPYLFRLAMVRLYSVVEAAADATFMAALARGVESDDAEALLRVKGANAVPASLGKRALRYPSRAPPR